MKSKEAIRNQILAYTNQIWGTKKIERLDLLVQMMVGTLVNELYLVHNKLNDIDTSLLEKIAQKLTPEQYMGVRPAHTVLQMKPNYPEVLLEQSNTFTLEWIPDDFVDEKADTIIFHPIADTYLYNAKVDNVFFNRYLYAIDGSGRRQQIATANGQSTTNSIWLGLDIDQDVENIKNLSFYIDFPKLSEIHELYEILPYTECYANGQEIRLKQGFPYHKEPLLESDQQILKYYNDHYLKIDESVFLVNLKKEAIPHELEDIIDSEFAAGLKPKYWFNLQFPSYFTSDYLRDATVAINTFPVVNRRLIRTNIIRDNLSKMTMLSSELGEKLLSIDSITDNRGRILHSDIEADANEAGTYHLETVNQIFIEELGLVDYLEHLLDLMDDERTAFSGIDKDRVSRVLSTLTEIGNEGTKKLGVNSRSKEEEITRLSVNPYENTTTVNIDYWVTYGIHLNNIPSEKLFAPDKVSKLDGLLAVSLCDIHGAKEISDIQDIMSIDKYIFTSKDRILTEHNIKCFCESELGRAIEKVEIKLDGKISPKPNEGFVRVIQVMLTPSSGYADLLYRKGVLKNLKVRLQERSPDDYNYNITISNR